MRGAAAKPLLEPELEVQVSRPLCHQLRNVIQQNSVCDIHKAEKSRDVFTQGCKYSDIM